MTFPQGWRNRNSDAIIRNAVTRPFGLNAFSFPFACGFVKRDGVGIAKPMDAYTLSELAARHDLSGLDIPLAGLLPDLETATVDRFAAALRARNQTFMLETGVIDVPTLQRMLPLVKRAGANTTRVMLSGFLEGGRAIHVPDWNAHMREAMQKLFTLYPLLDELDMRLAIENHQDATSDDLMALCTVGPRIGVNFDVVNPLAVAEEPFAFARKLGARVFNVHLKDYTIHPTPSGYKLVRAELGAGVIDWQALITLVREQSPDATFHIELAAIFARHIRFYEDAWWRGYPPRSAHDLLPTLRFAAQHAQPPGAESQTPWERGEPFDACERYERDQFDASVAFLNTLKF